MQTINFQTTADELLETIRQAPRTDVARALLIDYLEKMWNARGAADIALIETQLAQQMGATASGPYVKNLDRALRALDR